jgi:hypothetical protein
VEVSGQLHDAPLYTRGKNLPGTHWIVSWMGSRASSDVSENIGPESKDNCLTATVCLFLTVQYYLSKSCMCFRDVLSYIILRPKEIGAVCTASQVPHFVNDCRKLKRTPLGLSPFACRSYQISAESVNLKCSTDRYTAWWSYKLTLCFLKKRSRLERRRY